MAQAIELIAKYPPPTPIGNTYEAKFGWILLGSQSRIPSFNTRRFTSAMLPGLCFFVLAGLRPVAADGGPKCAGSGCKLGPSLDPCSLLEKGNLKGPRRRQAPEGVSSPGCPHVTGAGMAEVDGYYYQGTPDPTFSWVDGAQAYFVLQEATSGTQQGLIDLYYNKNTQAWMISKDGTERYTRSGSYFIGTWSTYGGSSTPAPAVAVHCNNCLAVSNAGTSRVNGDYLLATPDAAHTWVDTAQSYHVLTPATNNMISTQNGLVDLYYNKDS